MTLDMRTSRPVAGETSARLPAVIMRQCRETTSLKDRFFTENADHIASCARSMAAAFDRSGRLLVMGNGGSSYDAVHTSVEFMHPIQRVRD